MTREKTQVASAPLIVERTSDRMRAVFSGLWDSNVGRIAVGAVCQVRILENSSVVY